jgi:hypothetical protein
MVRPLSESAWARVRFETIHAQHTARFMWLGEGVSAVGFGALLTATAPSDIAILGQVGRAVLGAVVGLSVAAFCVVVFNLMTVPYKQRNEARASLSDLHASLAQRPVLKFVSLERTTEPRSVGSKPAGFFSLWRIRLENLTPHSEASAVMIRLVESEPLIPDIQMTLHEKDDHESRQERDVRFGLPVWIDILAKGGSGSNDALSAFRSDLPGNSYVSDIRHEMRIPMLAAMREPNGLRVKIVAAGKSPTQLAEQWVKFSITDEREFQAAFCDPPITSA